MSAPADHSSAGAETALSIFSEEIQVRALKVLVEHETAIQDILARLAQWEDGLPPAYNPNHVRSLMRIAALLLRTHSKDSEDACSLCGRYGRTHLEDCAWGEAFTFFEEQGWEVSE